MIPKATAQPIIRVLHVTRLSKGGMPVVLNQIVQGLNKDRYEPVVLFDTPQMSTIRTELVRSEVQTIELVKGQGIVNKSLTVSPNVSRNIGKAIQKKFGENGLSVYLFLKSLWTFLCIDLARVFTYLKVIKDNKIDIVHTHNNFSRGKPEILAAKIAGIPCVTHRHGYATYTKFDNFFLGLTSANIYISNHVADYHMERGEPRCKATVIHNGINPKIFLNRSETGDYRQEFGCKDGDSLVGLIARIDWWKGHEFFIEALAKVKESGLSVKGVVIGGLAELCFEKNLRYQSELETLVEKLNLKQDVLFAGHRDDLCQVIQSIDVLVHASSTPEPFGLVVIEGMAAGKPVVATGAGGVLDIIDDGVDGLLVPCKDSEAMAGAIIQILSKKSFANQLSQTAQKKVLRAFTIEKQVGAISDLYESFVGS